MRSLTPVPAVMACMLFISACTSPSPGTSSPATVGSATPGAPVIPGACRADPAQYAIGRTVDAALESDVRASSGAKLVRVLRPGQMVTMEFSAERLNLTVDAAGKVTRVSCG